MTGIKSACRWLGLSYRHWHEALIGSGPRIEMWAPGLNPITFAGGSPEPESFLVNGPEVRNALALLKRGRDEEAAQILDGLVPEFLLPRFEVSSDPHPSSPAVDDADVLQQDANELP